MPKRSRDRSTFILAPHDGAAVWTLRFPAAFLKLLPVLAVCLLASGIWLVKRYRDANRSAMAYERLLSENLRLQKKVSQLEQMEKDLEELERFGTRIRTFAGLGSMSPEGEESVPQGGPIVGDGVSEAFEPGPAYAGQGFGWSSVHGGMRDRLLLQRISFEEILSFVKEQQDRLAKTPAIWPVAKEDCPDRWISSGYGWRRSPFSGKNEMHTGLDIVAPRGVPIRVTADGVVKSASSLPGLGLTVIVSHDGKYETLYGHCDRILTKPGQTVRRGDTIAKVGRTGRTTGVHIHYEVRLGSKQVNPVDYLLD